MKKKLAIAFFFSGAAALVYQVLWVRMLGLVFGNTTYAVSTVLAAFMGGMALGSYLLGRYAERPGFRPVRTLAAIEGGIGLYCAVSPLLFAAASKIYILAQQGDLSLPAVTLLRFLLSSAILLLPTALMGGTLPVMTRALKTLLPEGGLSGAIGLFYGVNTAGAVFGVIFAAFFAIAALGVNATLAIAVGINLAVAALLYKLSANEAAAAPDPVATPAPAPDLKLARAALAAAAIAGFTSMICEVVWTRSLSMVIGMSVYAFAVMLAAFLAGIAAGSFFFTKYIEKRVKADGKEGFLAVGIMLGAAGVVVLTTIPLFNHLPLLFLRLFKVMSGSYAGLLAVQALFSFVIMALPAALFGLMFPAIIKIYSRAAAAVKTSAAVGKVYAFNTAGCIAGSLLAGFALISLLGLEGSIRAAGLVCVVSALAVLFLADSRRLALPIAGFLLLAAAPHLLAVGAWDKAVMNSGVYQYAADILETASSQGMSLSDAFKLAVTGDEQLYYKDGSNYTVAVARDAAGVLSLSIDGKVDASSNIHLDMQTQVLSGHLPMLLHPGAKRVLVIGLASGVTLGAVGAYPVEEIDCVEIEPSMREAAAYFAPWNGEILKDKRVRLIMNDGRNYLQATKKKYDVIISVPSNPWIPGSAALFTEGFLELAAKKLAPGGVFCQWVQSYEVRLDEVRSLVATTAGVFPGLSVWNPVGGDLLLVSAPGKFPLDYKDFSTRFGSVSAHLSKVGITEPLRLLCRYIMAGDELNEFTKGAAHNTDDRPLLEFSSPKHVFKTEASKSNLVYLLSRASPVSICLRGFTENAKLAALYLSMSLPVQAEKELRGIIKAKDNSELRDLLGQALVSQGRAGEGAAELERAVKLKPSNPGPKLNLSQLFLERGELDKALESAVKAIAAGGGAPAFNQAGLVSLKRGDLKKAADYFSKARSIKPDYIQAYINEAVLNLDYWDIPPAAYMLLDSALVYDRRSALVRFHYARALYRMGFSEQAAQNFRETIALQPELRPLVAREIKRLSGVKG